MKKPYIFNIQTGKLKIWQETITEIITTLAEYNMLEVKPEVDQHIYHLAHMQKAINATISQRGKNKKINQ